MYRRRKRRIIFFAIIVGVILFFIIKTFTTANEIVKTVAETKIRALAAEAVNEAVRLALDDGVKYADLVSVERDSNGKVLSITSNSLKINRMARDAELMSQQKINELSGKDISIPLGAFTGIAFLSGAGPGISVKILPVGRAECSFSSVFSSAGINQTKHSVFIHVLADISVIMLDQKIKVNLESEILVSESVIVGDVPDFYMGSDIFK